jgi:hypothetical protein
MMRSSALRATGKRWVQWCSVRERDRVVVHFDEAIGAERQQRGPWGHFAVASGAVVKDRREQ